mmetsp:Transcript_152366/g.277220  ORF Transcript_152366/g.277220 Transcript_152366/m.277220 type:complete len:328 (-) Transcript_152366:157-1140(-)
MSLEDTCKGYDEVEMQFTVSSLSGNGGTVFAAPSDALQELLARVQELVVVPADCQRWLLDQKEISLKGAARLADTEIRDGDHVTVTHAGSVDLLPLPSTFNLTLTSVRERFKPARYSSAFSILHKIHVNAPAGVMRHELWRKNDHDSISYNVNSRTKTLAHGHWMSGTQKTVRDLPENVDPIGVFVQAWPKRATPVWDPSERFWRSPDVNTSDDTGIMSDKYSKGDEQQSHPNYAAVRGWFIMPSDSCVEICAALPVGSIEEPSLSQKVIRLLLDESGTPIRAALNECRCGRLQEDIEEYDIVLQRVEADFSNYEKDDVDACGDSQK